MKKLLKIIIVLACLINIPITVQATSGACSSHGGVNCSAGASVEGKVQCNDGWVNSSVFFSDAQECKISQCTEPVGSGCKTENDYGVKQSEMMRSGGYLGGGVSQMSVLNQCRNEITNYQRDLQVYDNCLSRNSNYSTNQQYTPVSTVSKDDFINSKMGQYCKEKYGDKSNWTNEKCTCESGYLGDLTNNFKCIPQEQALDKFCKKEHGQNSILKNNYCSCSEGYMFDSNTQQCTLSIINTSITPQQNIQPVVIKNSNIQQLKNKIEQSSVKQNTIIKKEIEKISTSSDSIIITATTTTPVELQKPLKLKWYQKIFRWFKI